MIKDTKEKLDNINKLAIETAGSLAFVFEYFEANNTELAHMPSGSINSALAGAIRSLDNISRQLYESNDVLESLIPMDTEETGSAADANKIIDFYLANLDSDLSVTQKLNSRDKAEQMMRENQAERKQRLSAIEAENVTQIR